HQHYAQRNFAGDKLDSNPETPAKAGSAEPYDWTGYEPGVDTNHKLRIDTRPPKVAITVEDSGIACNYAYVFANISDFDNGPNQSGLQRVSTSSSVIDPANDPQKVLLGTISNGGSLHYVVEAQDKAGNSIRTEGDQAAPYAGGNATYNV